MNLTELIDIIDILTPIYNVYKADAINHLRKRISHLNANGVDGYDIYWMLESEGLIEIDKIREKLRKFDENRDIQIK